MAQVYIGSRQRILSSSLQSTESSLPLTGSNISCLQAGYTPVEEKKKTKTKGGKSGEGVGEGEDAAQDWSQDQQRALELALAQFPKVTKRIGSYTATSSVGDPDPDHQNPHVFGPSGSISRRCGSESGSGSGVFFFS
jgi:hypothetical protein